MTRQQINVRLPADLLAAAKQRPGTFTGVLEEALRQYLGYEGDDLAETVEDHERRIARLEEVAGL